MTHPPRLVNLTPHTIRVLTGDDRIVCELPAAPDPARRHETRTDAGHLTLGPHHSPVPLIRIGYGPVTALPPPQPGTWHIVSRIVADAAPHRTDLLVPHDVIRDTTGQITGCRTLALGAAHHPQDTP